MPKNLRLASLAGCLCFSPPFSRKFSQNDLEKWKFRKFYGEISTFLFEGDTRVGFYHLRTHYHTRNRSGGGGVGDLVPPPKANPGSATAGPPIKREEGKAFSGAPGSFGPLFWDAFPSTFRIMRQICAKLVLQWSMTRQFWRVWQYNFWRQIRSTFLAPNLAPPATLFGAKFGASRNTFLAPNEEQVLAPNLAHPCY